MSKTIKQLCVVVCLFAGSAFAQCTDPETPHAITGNFTVDLYGPVDTPPGCGPQKLNPSANLKLELTKRFIFIATKSQPLREGACDIVTDVTET